MFATLLVMAPSLAQNLPGRALVEALRAGGHTIVMRHASSPRGEPGVADVAAGNTDRERQLDPQGIATAIAMGEALRRLGIPVGEILSSPTFRGLQTARLLELGEVEAVEELGDGGRGMQPDAEGARSAWLRAKAAEAAPGGTNRLIVTHVPNLVGAFEATAADMSDGESLIVRPDGGRAVIVGRVEIDEWPSLDR